MASDRKHPGYTRVVEPGRRRKEPLSSDFEKYVTDYLAQVQQSIDSGKSANEAFKEVRPNLDHLQPHQLISTLWDNQALGKMSPASLGNIQGLDFYDVLQKLFERKVYELAVQWWGQQKTMRQVEQMREEAPAKPARDDTDEEGTVVLKKPASLIRHKGHVYKKAETANVTEAKMMLDSLGFPMTVTIADNAVQIDCASDIDLTDACKEFFADFVTPILVRYK